MANSFEMSVLDDAISIQELNLSEDQGIALTHLLRVYVAHLQASNDNEGALPHQIEGLT